MTLPTQRAFLFDLVNTRAEDIFGPPAEEPEPEPYDPDGLYPDWQAQEADRRCSERGLE